MLKRPEIREFFAGKSVLVTGATGFLGKALVEKMFRCCPDVNRLYLLVRSRGSERPEQRLKEFITSNVSISCVIKLTLQFLIKQFIYFDLQAFDYLRCKSAEVMTKLVLVNGDMTSNGLGISPEDLKALQDNVSVVFHSAGRVKFDDNFDEALEANVRGPQRLLEVCKNFRNLQVFIKFQVNYI